MAVSPTASARPPSHGVSNEGASGVYTAWGSVVSKRRYQRTIIT